MPLVKRRKHMECLKERILERKFVTSVKAVGGLALKFTSPSCAGMPDRLVLMPGGKNGFVEVKSPGCKPRPLQIARHGMLRRLGFNVFVLDKPEQIERIIKEIIQC